MAVVQLAAQRAVYLLSRHCARCGRSDWAALSPRLYASEETAPEMLEGIERALEAAVLREMDAGRASRYQRLAAVCALEPEAVCALDIALARLLFPDLEAPLAAMGGPTAELACAVCAVAQAEFSYARAERCFEQARALLRAEGGQPFFRRPLRADARLLGYLSGGDRLDDRLEGMAELCSPRGEPPPLFGRGELLREVSRALAWRPGREQAAVQIAGRAGSGGRLLLRHACRELGVELLFVDAAELLREEGALAGRMAAVRREMLFYECGVCFTGLTDENCAGEGAARFLRCCMERVWDLPYPVLARTEEGVELIAHTRRYLERVDVPQPARRERIALWEGFCARYGLSGVDCVAAGTKYRLNAAEIGKVVRRLAEKGEAPSRRDVSAACLQILPPPEGGIRRIEAGYTLDELKLPPEQKRSLLNICAHVRWRHRVYDEWNLESRYAYGKNVSALFVGAPGTGKTMAVHVLSNLLDLPLYRIDLSQVVDKYIGETEKRLEEIFTVAEKNNVILFFDEADSIFGKRSEVNDAKDKYANTEVSYILQRIEQYDGIVILATNYKRNIDEAFMRRMRYLVEFQMPGEALRRELWESAFAPETPTQGLDFDYLARQFELAGGAIKNIALNAAFLAAGENEPVGMRQILDSVRAENLKMGKTMLPQDFGEYGVLLGLDSTDAAGKTGAEKKETW